MNCERRFALEYVHGYSKPVALVRKVSAAEQGTAIHAGLEYHYKGQSWEDGVAQHTGDWDEATKTKVAKVVQHFLDVEDTAMFYGWEPVEIEQRITVHYGVFGDYNVYITGEPDMLMQDEFGDLVCIDHKTVNNVSNITGLPYKRQAYIYDWLITKSSGRELSAFIFNIIHREKILEPLHVDVVTFTPELRASFDKSLARIVDNIVRTFDAEHINETIPNPSKECTWFCKFAPICSKLDSDPEQAMNTLALDYTQDLTQTVFRSPEDWE